MNSTKWLALLWIFGLGLAMIFGFPGGEISATEYSIRHSLLIGHDAFGRSCLALTLVAARKTFLEIIPLLLVSLAASLALAYLRHWLRETLESWFSFWVDSFSVLPGLLIALSWSAYFPGSTPALWAATALMILPYLMRLWDGIILEIQLRQDFQSSLALGADQWHLFKAHFAPTLFSQVVALVPFLFTRLILIEVTFTFLGVGGVSQTESWGGLLFQGKDYLLEAPWILISVSAPLFLTLFSFHLLSKTEKT